MKQVRITYLGDYKDVPSLSEISAKLDQLPEKHQIDTVSWKEYSYKPQVWFAIGYSNSEVFVKYFVTENYLKAEMSNDNDPVCQDSCVEFFISPEDDNRDQPEAGKGHYYNFEFNCIGTCYMGHGTCREDSVTVDPALVGTIRRLSSRGITPFPERKGTQEWELTVAIPLSLIFKDVSSVKGKRARANFYKCGDNLTEPHYLSWNRVGTETPDYHTPAYFGNLIFD